MAGNETKLLFYLAICGDEAANKSWRHSSVFTRRQSRSQATARRRGIPALISVACLVAVLFIRREADTREEFIKKHPASSRYQATGEAKSTQ